jgi:hypothetical protein
MKAEQILLRTHPMRNDLQNKTQVPNCSLCGKELSSYVSNISYKTKNGIIERKVLNKEYCKNLKCKNYKVETCEMTYLIANKLQNI